MRTHARTTLTGVVVAAGLLLGSVAAPALAQQVPAPPPPPACPSWWCRPGTSASRTSRSPGPSGEIYGPTKVNATSANGRMAAAFDREGTITVLRYPRPSYYDQVKFRTSSRDDERYGALENEGAFLGLLVPGEGTTWLRDTPSSQRYRTDASDTVELVHDVAELGVEVTVTDTVAADDDALVRTVDVRVTDPAAVPDALQVVAFENLNLTVNRVPYFPVLDWCTDELNVDTATVDPAADAIVHEASGHGPGGRRPGLGRHGHGLRPPVRTGAGRR